MEYVSADVNEVAEFVGGDEFEEFKRIFGRFAPAETLLVDHVRVKMCMI